MLFYFIFIKYYSMVVKLTNDILKNKKVKNRTIRKTLSQRRNPRRKEMAKMTNAKFEVEKFTGKNNFALWKLKVRDLMVQQGLHKALDGAKKKPANMIDSDWEDLDA